MRDSCRQEENETLLPLDTVLGLWRTVTVTKGVEVRRSSHQKQKNVITWRDVFSQTAKPPLSSSDKLFSAFFRLGMMGGDLSHWQLLAVADNFLPVDSHPVRPVHTTTFANDMTDKVLDEWLYTTCGNTEKDRKKPFVLIKKKKLSLKWKRKH